VTERFQMIRVSAGDYLLPANDLVTLWRVYAYDEHGDAVWVDEEGKEHEIRGRFWGLAKRPMPTDEAQLLADDAFLEWEHWSTWADGFATRRDAIDEALGAA
jgi:hypothetical protein